MSVWTMRTGTLLVLMREGIMPSTRSGFFLPYLFATASLAFAWSFLAVTTEAFPMYFFAPIRGAGLIRYNTTIVLINLQLDPFLLLSSTVVLLLLFWGKVRRGSPGKNTLVKLVSALMLVSAMLEALTSLGAVLLVLAVTGTVYIGYCVMRSSAIFHVSPRNLLAMILLPGTAIFSVISIISATRWVINGADGAVPLSDPSWSLNIIELKLTNLPNFLLPNLVLLFFLSWALRWIASLYWDDLRRAFSRLSRVFHGTSNLDYYWQASPRLTITRLIFVLSVISGAFVGVYPYLPAINPDSVLVGVDVTQEQFYYNVLKTMFGLQPLPAVRYALSNARSLYFLLQYSVSKLVNSPDVAIRLMPSILAVLLVVSTYWFVKAASDDRLLSATASMLAAFSFQVTAGIDGGYYANWLALAEAFAFLALFISGLKKNNMKYVPALAVLSFLVLFAHLWTWFLLIAVVVTYLPTTVLLTRRNGNGRHLRAELIFVASVLLINLVPVAVAYFLPIGSGLTSGLGQRCFQSTIGQGCLEYNIWYYLRYLDVSNLISVAANLQVTINNFLAGAVANPPMIILSIVGVLAMSDLRSRGNRLLLSWVAFTTVGILLTGPVTAPLTQTAQARIFYVVPFQIFAAMGFLTILRYVAQMLSIGESYGSRHAKLFEILAYVALFSIFISYALQTIGYLYLGS